MKKLSTADTLSAVLAAQDGSADANTLRKLKSFLAGGGMKRGFTKPVFNKVKARAKGKAQRAARKANTGSVGKRGSKTNCRVALRK